MIVPGCWVTTARWGKAVCLTVEPHDHGLVERRSTKAGQGIGWRICACENDDCKDALLVTYRYRARRCVHDKNGNVIGYEDKDIWVLNSDLTTEVSFLAPPTRFTARILKLKGGYGEDAVKDAA